jgi:hypothetical protein
MTKREGHETKEKTQNTIYTTTTKLMIELRVRK